MGIENIGLINNPEPQRDPKKMRKEQLKARGPQEKPNFLVSWWINL
jgi:hypothetical protein